MVIEAPKHDVSFQVFNSGGEGNNATKQMIVNEILKLIPNGKVEYNDHGSDPRNYRINFQKVKNILGFEPIYTINDGISELIFSINNHLFDNVDLNNNFYGNCKINYKTSE